MLWNIEVKKGVFNSNIHALCMLCTIPAISQRYPVASNASIVLPRAGYVFENVLDKKECETSRDQSLGSMRFPLSQISKHMNFCAIRRRRKLQTPILCLDEEKSFVACIV